VIPKPAQYLLRFDDLCPTMSRDRWQLFRALVDEFKVHPILAIIPDNLDSTFERSANDPGFWTEMRNMEAAGAIIAVHGYQHLCHSHRKSMLALHRRSEFAGVDITTQREWIRVGLEILRSHGLNPRLWVAPRHGFDRNTVFALRREGVGYISDGFARIPFKRHGLTWLPQQLWSPVHKSKGVWTICIHPYAACGADVDKMRSFLTVCSGQFTSFDRLLEETKITKLGLRETIYEKLALWRIQVRRKRSRRRRLKF
jgi:predicted deacetylase